ncbi:MAG: hypothetical protein CVV24_00790 [Ignavibacteriae bacterium HGW-Ignavibacteriae-3]|nr:MAG: hypothetical protein CVV24_00790 [Ignavibacteriae bacterium HGW-Ignavibacteriae-3]
MDNSHIFLVLGAIVLLAILVLNVNRTILSSADNALQAEAITTTTSVAQRTIDLISSKAFDNATVNAPVTNTSDLTAPGLLGPDSGENVNSYNDVDDYNNYSAVISTPRLGNVGVRVNVRYVNPSQPDQIASTQTRMKRIKVLTTSVYMPDTLRLYYYSSY